MIETHRSYLQGYFQSLFSCIEGLLDSLKVKHLVLPAAEEAEAIWTKKFGFSKISLDQVLRNLSLSRCLCARRVRTAEGGAEMRCHRAAERVHEGHPHDDLRGDVLAAQSGWRACQGRTDRGMCQRVAQFPPGRLIGVQRRGRPPCLPFWLQPLQRRKITCRCTARRSPAPPREMRAPRRARARRRAGVLRRSRSWWGRARDGGGGARRRGF